MKKPLLAVLALIVLAAFVVSRPVAYHVERSTLIDAPGAVVFAQIDDFHKWQAWSPWGTRVTGTTVSYDGPESGKGASYHWAGSREVGEGRMTIVDSSPGQNVSIQLELVRPYRAKSLSRFILLPEPPGVSVVWMADGRSRYVERVLGVDRNRETTIGPAFEKGLAGLKIVSEAAATPPAPTVPADSSLSERRARRSP
jgi:hypothetical protein